MASAAPAYSVGFYLESERQSQSKHEFFDGQIVAMAGASLRHVQLQTALTVELAAAVRGRDRQVLGADMKVRAGAGRLYAYPDVAVVCGRPMMADEHNDVLVNPIAIFEVLSPSTERYDRGIKFENYRGIASLQDYVLMDPDRLYAEHYTRFQMPGWSLRELRYREQELRLDSVGIAVTLGDLYQRLELPEIEPPFASL